MKKEVSKEEAVFPVCVLEIDRGDIECAMYSFEEDVQEQLKEIPWSTKLLDAIRGRIREDLMHYYRDCDLLPRAIEEALKDEIKERKSKRSFLNGLKEYIIGNKKK